MLSLKYLRHPLNRIQSKNHKIETCKMNKISLPNFMIKFLFLIMYLKHYLLVLKFNLLNASQKLFLNVDLAGTAFLPSYKIVNFQPNQNSFFKEG